MDLFSTLPRHERKAILRAERLPFGLTEGKV